MAAEMEFGLLGPLEVHRGDAEIPVPPGKQRAVLAALLLEAGRVVTVDDLVDALWRPEPPPSARVSVQNYVMRLRKVLSAAGRPLIGTWPGGYLMSVGPGELDVTRFETLLRGARAAAQDRAWDTAATRARTALALWRGEPLADVGSDLLMAREVPRLAEMRLTALETGIDADLHRGRHADAVAELRHLVAAHPLRERLHGLLMLALYRDGRRAEALTAYQQARQVIAGELGAEPGSGLQELHQRMLAAGPFRLARPRHRPPSAGRLSCRRNGRPKGSHQGRP